MWRNEDGQVFEVHNVVLPKAGAVPVAKGEFHRLPLKVQKFIAKWIETCTPRCLYICDGSDGEAEEITAKLIERGLLTKLHKLENCYLARTDPEDVARVESKTWVCTEDKYATVPHVRGDKQGELGHWMSLEDLDKELQARMPGCMAGRCMYVIPFSMGPIGGPMSKIGIQITDANYVVLSMRIMTRVSPEIWDLLHHSDSGDFVRCVHSVGLPRPVQRKVINHWPCNPSQAIITHVPDERLIISFGSGYGGNSLLGKKCFALRIGSKLGHAEDWLAEHMLIMTYQKNHGPEMNLVAAFPSGCGKTNLALLTPPLPEYQIHCIGDDITWMKFGPDGILRGLNPEFGFFGIAPGTNQQTNPTAMQMVNKNTIFTNVAETSDGGYYWQAMEKEVDPNVKITNWLGEPYTIGDPNAPPPAHPNSRFCTPVVQCPTLHPEWYRPDGFPVNVVIFGGRRPHGVPLVFESFNWKHGVMLGAMVKSEATAAAEHKAGTIMHDPFAMRPFFGYNFGHYMQHWLDQEKPGRKMPRIFYVNWFRRGKDGKFLWPGYGENIRVLDWIEKRLHDDKNEHAVWSPIGWLPKKESFRLDGLDEQTKANFDELFSVPTDWWLKDTEETEQYLEEQCTVDLPADIRKQLHEQVERLKKAAQ